MFMRCAARCSSGYRRALTPVERLWLGGEIARVGRVRDAWYAIARTPADESAYKIAIGPATFWHRPTESSCTAVDAAQGRQSLQRVAVYAGIWARRAQQLEHAQSRPTVRAA
jgi:hypothetical protein